MTHILDFANKECIENILRAAPAHGQALPGRLKWDLLRAFEFDSTPQGPMYWLRKAEGSMRWAKKDTKFLQELLGIFEPEEDIWL